MGHPRGLDHPSAFQFNVLGANVVEQSPTVAKQHGHEVNLNLVEGAALS
jgi:hypothetical protein